MPDNILYDKNRYKGNTKHYETILKEIEWTEIFLNTYQPTPQTYNQDIQQFVQTEVEEHEYHLTITNLENYLNGNPTTETDYQNPNYPNGIITKTTHNQEAQPPTYKHIPYRPYIEHQYITHHFNKINKIWEHNGHLYIQDTNQKGITQTTEIRQPNKKATARIQHPTFQPEQHLQKLWDDPEMCPPLNYTQTITDQITTSQPTLNEIAHETRTTSDKLNNKPNPTTTHKQER